MVSHETENTELRIEKATKRSSLFASLSFHRDASTTVCNSICATLFLLIFARVLSFQTDSRFLLFLSPCPARLQEHTSMDTPYNNGVGEAQPMGAR